MSTYNGIGINRDILTSTPVVIGSVFTATLVPQQTRGPGPWTVLIRSAPNSFVLDLGLFFFLPPAGNSELLVDPPSFITNINDPGHSGGGIPDSVSATVPNNCSLVGMDWYGQAIVLGDLPFAIPGVLDPWFSSAVTGIIGTF